MLASSSTEECDHADVFRLKRRFRMTTRQYARHLADWLTSIDLDPHLYGTHSLRRTKATLIYRRTGNLRAVELLLGDFWRRQRPHSRDHAWRYICGFTRQGGPYK
jgi:site-specific recombinase XerC